MSYDIRLCDPVTGEVLELDSLHDMRGGTYVLGGTKEAWLNVTYNYSKWYYAEGVFRRPESAYTGIRSIYDLSGAESIPILERAIETLKSCDCPFSDEELKEYEDGYWKPTRENAIRPLYQLLAFAKMRPDGVWGGD